VGGQLDKMRGVAGAVGYVVAVWDGDMEFCFWQLQGDRPAGLSLLAYVYVIAEEGRKSSQCNCLQSRAAKVLIW
jgi:hypothetical protein